MAQVSGLCIGIILSKYTGWKPVPPNSLLPWGSQQSSESKHPFLVLDRALSALFRLCQPIPEAAALLPDEGPDREENHSDSGREKNNRNRTLNKDRIAPVRHG